MKKQPVPKRNQLPRGVRRAMTRMEEAAKQSTRDASWWAKHSQAGTAQKYRHYAKAFRTCVRMLKEECAK